MHACAIQHIQVSLEPCHINLVFFLYPSLVCFVMGLVGEQRSFFVCVCPPPHFNIQIRFIVYLLMFQSIFQVNSYQNTKTRESLTLDYVKCLMQTANSFKDTLFPGARCARELQLPNWNIIEECANSTEGSKLLQGYGETTHILNPALSFVPTITFNHVSTSNQ